MTNALAKWGAPLRGLSRLLTRQSSLPKEGPGEVRVLHDTIIYTSAENVMTFFSLNVLDEVSVEVDDRGPFEDDVFWRLSGRGGLMLIPSTSDGTERLLNRLQTLPDFDNEAVIKAMATTDVASFTVWRSERKRAEEQSAGRAVG